MCSTAFGISVSSARLMAAPSSVTVPRTRAGLKRDTHNAQPSPATDAEPTVGGYNPSVQLLSPGTAFGPGLHQSTPSRSRVNDPVLPVQRVILALRSASIRASGNLGWARIADVWVALNARSVQRAARKELKSSPRNCFSFRSRAGPRALTRGPEL